MKLGHVLSTQDVIAPEFNDQQVRIQAFAKRYGDAHLRFAYYAALPLSLTPDLLDRLWLWGNIHNEDPENIEPIPWLAVSDFLVASGFCETVGHQLYEIEPCLRQALLSSWESDPRFGETHIQELAEFILDYTDRQLHSPESMERDHARVQRWGALAYHHPKQVAQELGQALSHAYKEDLADLNRIATVVVNLAGPLKDYPNLLVYARGMTRYARGDETGAFIHLKDFFVRENLIIEGVRLPLPTLQVNEAVSNQEQSFKIQGKIKQISMVGVSITVLLISGFWASRFGPFTSAPENEFSVPKNGPSPELLPSPSPNISLPSTPISSASPSPLPSPSVPASPSPSVLPAPSLVPSLRFPAPALPSSESLPSTSPAPNSPALLPLPAVRLPRRSTTQRSTSTGKPSRGPVTILPSSTPQPAAISPLPSPSISSDLLNSTSSDSSVPITAKNLGLLPISLSVNGQISTHDVLVKGLEDGVEAIHLDRWHIPLTEVAKSLKLQVKKLEDGTLALINPAVSFPSLKPIPTIPDAELGLVVSIETLKNILDINVQFDMLVYGLNFDVPWISPPPCHDCPPPDPVLTDLPTIRPTRYSNNNARRNRIRSQGTLILTAFLDENSNGYQDQGEESYLYDSRLLSIFLNNTRILKQKSLVSKYRKRASEWVLKIKPGMYRIDLDPEGYKNIDWQPIERSYAVEVRRGHYYTQLKVPFVPAHTVVGSVFHPNGQILKGVRVEAFSKQTGHRVTSTTNVNGLFFLDDLKRTAYTIKINGKRSIPHTILIDKKSQPYFRIDLREVGDNHR